MRLLLPAIAVVLSGIVCSAQVPSEIQNPDVFRINKLPARTAVWPEPSVKAAMAGDYDHSEWVQSLNGYLPDSLGKVSETGLEFSYEDSFAAVTERWSLDPVSPGDIKVEMTLTAKKPGYWSLSSPSVVAADKYDARKSKFSTFAGKVIKNNIASELKRRLKESDHVSLEKLMEGGEQWLL